MLISYFADSQYNSESLELALKEVFGSQKMCDISPRFPRTKIAVTATRVPDSSTYLITNYSRNSQSRKRWNYKLLKDDVET